MPKTPKLKRINSDTIAKEGRIQDALIWKEARPWQGRRRDRDIYDSDLDSDLNTNNEAEVSVLRERHYLENRAR
jgi:hypothetical protein